MSLTRQGSLSRLLRVVVTAGAVLGLGFVAVSTQLAAGTAVMKARTSDRDSLQGALSGLTEQYFNATFLAAQSAAGATAWTLTAKDVPALQHITRTSRLAQYGAALVTLGGRTLAASTSALPPPTDAGYAPLRAQLLNGQPGLSDVMHVGTSDVVAFAVPVLRSGVPVAVLLSFADIRKWDLQGYDETLTIGKKAVPYVLDSKGVVAASGEIAALGQQVGLPTPAHTTSKTWRGKKVVISAGASGHGWHVVTAQDAAAWSAGVTSTRERALVALAALLTLVVALLVWFYVRQQSVQRRLADERLYDPLTGLAQRRLFELKLDAAFARLRRSQTPVALLYCDLDGFKAVNDQHGHNAGDQLLKTVAGRLSASVREEDMVVRFGGDEFGVLVEGMRAAELTVLVRRIYASVEQPVIVGRSTSVVPRLSIGAAVTDHDSDTEALVHAADLAMYEVKSSRGSERIIVTDLSATSREQASSR